MTVASVGERISTIPELFAPELSMATDNFDHARDACERDFDYRRLEITLDRLSLDEEFRVSVDGGKYILTEKAFDDIGAILDVPPRFAREITRELFTIIVDRLGQLHQQAVVLVVRDGIIVAVVDPAKWSGNSRNARPHYEPVSNLELLSLIENVWSTPGGRLRINVSDAGLAIEVVDPNITIEPKVGDVINVGAVVTGSETGGPAPLARGYTLRLVCSNGAAIPSYFGTARFSTDWRVRHDRRLEVFGRVVEHFSVNMELVRQAYQGVVDGELNDQSFWAFHRQAAYVFRGATGAETTADAMFGVEEARRKQLVAAVRKRQGLLRHGRNDAVLLPQPSGIRAWDAYNGITAAARDETSYARRVALERLGGDLLKEFAPEPAV